MAILDGQQNCLHGSEREQAVGQYREQDMQVQLPAACSDCRLLARVPAGQGHRGGCYREQGNAEILNRLFQGRQQQNHHCQ